VAAMTETARARGHCGADNGCQENGAYDSSYESAASL
jgi:hypothetical protein